LHSVSRYVVNSGDRAVRLARLATSTPPTRHSPDDVDEAVGVEQLDEAGKAPCWGGKPV
jgi:hypothetical protein